VIVLDTNVVSELMKQSPEPSVERWVLTCTKDELFTTAITLAEVFYGVERLPIGRRKDQIRLTATTVFGAFKEHVLPFDAEAAMRYSTIVDGRDHIGHPIDGFDAQIAAICRANDAVLATRNVKDFSETGIDVIDPWQAE
jgi:predicted nucleic acid-binding protein